MRGKAVEPVPDRLRPLSNLVGGHHRVRHVDLRPPLLRDQPVAGDRDAADRARRSRDLAFPLLEVDRAGKRREHHELRERDAGAVGEVGGGLEGVGAVAGQAEDERAEHMDAARAKGLEPFDEGVPGEVEPLVDVLQPLRRHRLDADERALDARPAHRVEEVGILGRLHGDLGEEHHVVGKLREAGHQGEPLGPDLLELPQPRRIGATAGLGKVAERHGIEIVVGERDEPEPAAPQLDRLADHRVDARLPRRLAVGAPHRAERAMLRAPAHRLHRRPHVASLGQEIPARDAEAVAADLAGLVDAPRGSGKTVVDHRGPHPVAVAAHDGVRAAALEHLLREERRVNAAEHHVRAALARQRPDLVAAQGVAGVNADPDHVAGGDLVGIERVERFVAEHGVAPARRGRRRQDVHPSRRDDGGAEGDVTRVDQEHTHGGASPAEAKNAGKNDWWLEAAGERLAGPSEETADRRAGALGAAARRLAGG